jgi:hypothetical protein
MKVSLVQNIDPINIPEGILPVYNYNNEVIGYNIDKDEPYGHNLRGFFIQELPPKLKSHLLSKPTLSLLPNYSKD